jgi:hypothetical protein
VLLWIAAFVLAVSLGYFQRTTGPTYPVRGQTAVGEASASFKLPRSHGGEGGLAITVETSSDAVSGELEWRRFPTREPWTTLPMTRDVAGRLTVEIPHHPPAGKVEYRLALHAGGERVSVPAGEPVVARFRGDVPAHVLIPHIIAMFASMMVATRALLEVMRPGQRTGTGMILTAMVLLVLGGLFLGPVVQKYAFGAYWTGWPFGTDLTDNKTAVAVLAWLPAVVVALRRGRTRWAVVVGWVVMMGVFLVPHSLRGSELDWSETPAPPTEVTRPSG